MFRVVVQDSRRTPTSGKVVALLGSYDPHAKTVTLSKDKAQFYLDHGAQPSERVVKILTSEGVKLPGWVRPSAAKTRAVRNPDKQLRKNRPAVSEAVDNNINPESSAATEPAGAATAASPEESTSKAETSSDDDAKQSSGPEA